MKALFLVNARSGVARRRDLGALVRRHCRLEAFDVTACERKEDLDGIVADAARCGVDAIVAVGGDGTVHEVAKRLIGTPLALGIVPTGSGNGFARHLRVSCHAPRAIASLHTSWPIAVDTAEVNGMPYVGVLGVGYDAEIASRFAAQRRRGLATYFAVALPAALSMRGEEIEVEIEGERIRRRVLVAVVANGSQYGNNARIAPLASVRDGLLDVVLIDDVPLVHGALLSARIFAGSIHRSRAVTMRKAATVTIRRAEAGVVNADGEPLAMAAELQFRVRPASLNVLVTRDPV